MEKLREANDNVVVVNAFKERLGLPVDLLWRVFLNFNY